MKKYVCIAILLAFAVALLSACTPIAVEELNQSYSNAGLRITATDLLVEWCPSGHSFLVVTTYFLVENITRWRTISIWIESDSYLQERHETFRIEDISPRSSVEISVPMRIRHDANHVWHGFYINENTGALARFRLSLDLSGYYAVIQELIEELNQPYSNRRLRMTATDLHVERCPTDDGNLIATTYFLLENTTSEYISSARIESFSTAAHVQETFIIEEVPPYSDLEFYVPMIFSADASHVGHELFLSVDMGPLAVFFLSLDLAR